MYDLAAVNSGPLQAGMGRVNGGADVEKGMVSHHRGGAKFTDGWLAAIVESSDDAIISKDLNGRITSWNGAAERLFGYTAQEVVGRHISLLAPPGREVEMSNILERIRKGERVHHYEAIRRHKDGRLIDVSLTVSPICYDDGRIVGASKIARDITERKRADERLRLLMHELDHRAKNVLAVTQAMISLTRADTIEQFVSIIRGRIDALALVHSQVVLNRWDGADLLTLVRQGLAPFQSDNTRIAFEGPEVILKPAAAQAVGTTLHELATNATKYGALSVAMGSVELTWSIQTGEPGEQGRLALCWTERGGPPVTAPDRRGFGTRVIERNIPHQLGGVVRLHWLDTGLRCEIVLPDEHMAPSPPAR